MPRDGAATPKRVVRSRGTLGTHPVPARAHPPSLSPPLAKSPRQAPLRSTSAPFPAINGALWLCGQTLSWSTTDRNSTIYTHPGSFFCPAPLKPGLAKEVKLQNKSRAGRGGDREGKGLRRALF